MKERFLASPVAVCLGAATCALLAAPLFAADGTKGKLTVGGTPVAMTYTYAYFDKTFNEGKDAVVVVLTDAPLPADAVQSSYARNKLVEAGQLSYVELMVSPEKQEIHYEVQDKHFGMMMQPSGDDSDHVLEVKTLDGKTIAGHARTVSAQKSLDDVPYSYDITFSAEIAPAKQN